MAKPVGVPTRPLYHKAYTQSAISQSVPSQNEVSGRTTTTTRSPPAAPLRRPHLVGHATPPRPRRRSRIGSGHRDRHNIVDDNDIVVRRSTAAGPDGRRLRVIVLRKIRNPRSDLDADPSRSVVDDALGRRQRPSQEDIIVGGFGRCARRWHGGVLVEIGRDISHRLLLLGQWTNREFISAENRQKRSIIRRWVHAR